MKNDSFHNLLVRQLRRSGVAQNHITESAEISELLMMISDTYMEFDQYRELLGRAMRVTSEELKNQQQKLQANLQDQRSQESRLRHHHFYDKLTGLPNRMLLIDRLQQALQSAERQENMVALLLMDIDHFKRINEIQGHELGDRLLLQFVKRIRGCLREGDTIARVGGDEFVIMLERLENIDLITHICEQLLQKLSRPFTLQDAKFNMQCSIGISVFDKDGDDAEELMRKAELAMRESKEQGRNCFQYFNDQLERKALMHMELERCIRHALDENLLDVYFQPQLDLQTQRIVAAEALLRVRSEFGMHYTIDELIHTAEKIGQIERIGKFVIDRVITTLGELHRKGQALQISVNLSAKELVHPQCARRIFHKLQCAGVPPHYLQIEITETVLMTNIEQAKYVLLELQSYGISIAIDDFGTGYSSLRYLQELPINWLKIDRSFVSQCYENKAREILITMLQLAHNLKMGVVAEGIEEQQVMEFLRDHGCEVGQGLYYSPAIPIDELLQLTQEFASQPSAKQFLASRSRSKSKAKNKPQTETTVD